ncbi:purine and uridine phosphorylase, partial [Macroventuria anomochaeta]
MARTLRCEDYTVGWVCALPVELAAAQEMLDEEHNTPPYDAHDTNLYTCGRVSEHNVVIACLPEGQTGTNSAAAVAVQMKSTFSSTRFGLMVGIGGGVPSEEADIRLGDVVVSKPHKTHGGVVQYDSGKATPSGFERTGALNAPPTVLLNAVANLRAKQMRGRGRLLEYLSKLDSLPDFSREAAGSDTLFEMEYDHIGGRATCAKCSTEYAVTREIRKQEVVVHHGTIASGNQVMRSAAERDRVSAELGGVLCFEMEAAGLMNSFPCLVVRGVCDYADSHKNKRWQAYAAGTAAAYAKEVLSVIPPSMVEAEKKISEVLSVITDIHQVADDHRNIAKDGLAVSQKSLEFQQKAHERKLSDRQAECLQLFRLTKSTEDVTYEEYKERIADRVEGTCMWFLNHPHFQKWKEKESGPLLVSADPGCGKSVLAKCLIDQVLTGSSTVCYFFFKDQVQNTVREALCALLHQLFSQKSSLLAHAIKRYEKDGKGLVNSKNSLWTIFGDAVKDPNAGSIIIVLDALDECAESEMEGLMHNIETEVRNCESSGAKVKFLLTSRPYEHIISELHSLSEAYPHIHIPGEDESETISREVNCVIRYRVDQFTKKERLSEEIKTCLEDRLLTIEHRTYLWVYLVFDSLKDFGFKRTPKGMASALMTLPRSVDQVYEQILNKSKDRSMVQKALSIVLAANRPLTLSEMSIAIEVDGMKQSIDDLDLEQEEDFKSRLRSWCGLFVSVHHGKVYLLHQTAREFLLAERLSSTTISKELQWHGFTTIEDAHTVLAECCVRFLSFFDYDSSLTTDQKRNIKNHAFLEYSARFWGLHLRESSICDDEGATVAPLIFNLSNPGSKVYSVWSRIYWSSQYLRDPRSLTSLVVACYFGHLAVAKKLLEKGADINAQGGWYGNALQAASYEGHEQIAMLLLEKGANVD